MVSTALIAQFGLLAQEPAPPGGGLMQLVVPFALIALLYYMMFVLPQRMNHRQLEDLASRLKENDHILTKEGIYGVVTNVQRDANRVTLRIDETTGAKMRVTLSAIGRVLDDGKDNPKDK